MADPLGVTDRENSDLACPVRLAPLDFRDPDAVVAAPFLDALRLHPFGDGDPRLVRADLRDAEVAEPRAAFGHQHALGRAEDAQPLGIDLRDEQRRAVAEDMVVVRSAAGVDEKQPVAVRHPMLLRVVVAQLGAVVERPGSAARRSAGHRARGDVALLVVAEREEEATAELGQRRLAEPARDSIDSSLPCST